MLPSTALQDAVALLTVAVHADQEELDDLIAEFVAEDDPDALLHAVVGLCRSLCLATSRMVHIVDDELTNAEALDLTDDELLPVALEVVRSYAKAAAVNAITASD